MQEETHTCAYCGAPATHQFKNGKWCCNENRQQCPVMIQRRAEKATHNHLLHLKKYGTNKFLKGQVAVVKVSSKYPSRGEHICVYCGEYAEFQLKSGKWCCKPSRNQCPVIRQKNSIGLKHSYQTGDRVSAMIGHTAWNKGLTKETSDIMKRISEKQLGVYKPGHPHTEEFKQQQRQRALKQGLGGFHMRTGIDYNGIKLDSTYEVMLAQDLDRNGIRWERCKRFPYHMNGKLHHYTPDFYLPDYDVYLDPKNDFLIEHVNPRLGFKDSDKIAHAEKENGIRVLVLNQHQLSWEFIKQQL